MLEGIMLKDMTWQEADEAMKKARAVILPLGSFEQHGYHMTLNTDNIVADHIAKELAKATDCVVMPTLPYGQVWSAKDFPGTISLKERTFITVVKDIVESLESKGVKNIILFSGHWGNVAPLKIAVRELLDEKGYENVYYLSYMDLKKHGAGIMETKLWNGSGFHAGEIETSVLLAIDDTKVRMDKANCEYPEVPSDVGIRPIPWKKFAVSGIFGDATKATKEKGEAFIDNWMNDMVTLIKNNIK